MEKLYTINDLKSDLNMEDTIYEELIEEDFEFYNNIVDKINSDNTLIPVWASMLDEEIEFLREEENQQLIVVEDCGCILLYRKENGVQND